VLNTSTTNPEHQVSVVLKKRVVGSPDRTVKRIIAHLKTWGNRVIDVLGQSTFRSSLSWHLSIATQVQLRNCKSDYVYQAGLVDKTD